MTAASTFPNDRTLHSKLLDSDTKELPSSSSLSAVRQRLLQDEDLNGVNGSDASAASVPEVEVILKVPRGERHIQACAGMFRISKNLAAQLTVQALKKLKAVEDVMLLRSLVGSPALVLAVRDVYYDQRVARLQLLSEVLRIDQDCDHALNAACRAYLDSDFSSVEKLEELFQQLLKRATLSLSESKLFSSESFFGHRDECSKEIKYDWNSFYKDLKDGAEAQSIREREESLKTLIVLLFSRLDLSSEQQCSSGKGSQMLLDLLNAFMKVKFYVSETKWSSQLELESTSMDCSAKRLPKLASLLCTEAMGLWRTSSSDSNWWKGHSFLKDLSEYSENELKRDRSEKIFNALADGLHQVSARRDSVYTELSLTEYNEKVDRNIEKPEALVLLSFGLLLRLATAQCGTNPNNNGIATILDQLEASPNLILEKANDVGAFDYFSEVLNELVLDETTLLVKHEMQVEGYRNENAIYASISRELLSASLQSTYLLSYTSSDHDRLMNISDLSMFCDLAHSIHKNQPELCRSFWMFWEGAYCQQSRLADIESISSELFPLCKLLEMSFKIASMTNQLDENIDPLSNLSPLLRLLAGLVCDDETAVCAMAVVQNEILPSAILGIMQQLFPGDSSLTTRNTLIMQDSVQDSSNSTNSVVEFLDQLALSGGNEVRSSLTQTFDKVASIGHFTTTQDSSGGAQALCTAAIQSPSVRTTAKIWSLIASIVKSPDSLQSGWLKVISRRLYDGSFVILKQYQDVDIKLDKYFFILADAAVFILRVLLSHFAVTSTKGFLEVIQWQHHLTSIIEGLSGVCDVLSMSVRSLTLEENQTHFEEQFKLNTSCLKALNEGISALGVLSRRQEMGNCSYLFKDARDTFLHRLATDLVLCEGVVSCATLPVSSALRSVLVSSREQASVHLSQGDCESMPSKYGTWSYIQQENLSPSSSITDPKSRAIKALSNSIDLDEGIIGSFSKKYVVLDQAVAAISLLISWSDTIEEVVEERYGCAVDILDYALEDEGHDVLEVSARNITSSTKEDMRTELESLSPMNLLFERSNAPFPVAILFENEPNISLTIGSASTLRDESSGVGISKMWSLYDISNLVLLGHYVGNNHSSILSSCALECIGLYLRHTGSKSTFLGFPSAQKFEGKDAFRFLQRVISCNSILAADLINNKNVCNTLVSPLTKVSKFLTGNILDENENLIDAVEAAKCIALLWETTRVNEKSGVELRKGIDILLKDELLWESCCNIIESVAPNIESFSHSMEHRVLRSRLLSLASSCVRIITVEVHVSFGKLPAKIHAFFDVAADEKKYDAWTDKYVDFDGDLISDYHESVRGVFEQSSIVLPPSIFVSHIFSLRDQAYDIEMSSLFFPGTSIVNSLIDANASWALAYEQSKAIRSWKRFMDVVVLRSHRSLKVSQNTEESSSSEFPSTPKNSDRDNISPTPLVLGRKPFEDKINYIAPSTPKVLEKQPQGSSFVGDNRSYSMIRHFLQALVSHGHNIHEVMSLGGNASCLLSVKVATEIAETLVSMLHHQLVDVVVKSLDPSSAVTEPRKETRLGRAECSELLYILQTASTRLLLTTRPSASDEQSTTSEIIRRQSYMLACRLRLHLFTASLLLIQANDSNDASSVLPTPAQGDLFSTMDRKSLETRLGLADLVCETLLILSYVPDGWTEVPSGNFPYSFEAIASSTFHQSGQMFPLELLRVCLKLLRKLLPNSTSGYIYSSDLVSAFERGHLRSSLLNHLNNASKVAAECNSSPSRGLVKTYTKQANSLSIVRAVMEFVSLGAEYPEFLPFLAESGFIFRIISSNKLLQEGCLQWDNIPKNLSHIRGYTEKKNEAKRVQSRQAVSRGEYVEDDTHGIWLLTLKSVSSILRTLHSRSEHGNVSTCLDDVVSFLHTFERTLLCGISIPKQSEKGGVKFRLTVQGLNETKHCLTLLKEICSKSTIRYFMSSMPELLNRLLDSGVKAMKNLSAFLQSTSVARDLFAAVLKIQALENNIATNNSPSMQEIMALSTFNSGSSAKHDVLKHAQFAKSCCVCMTSEDSNLLNSSNGEILSEMGEKKTRSPSDLAQNSGIFRKSVDNDFVRKIEYTAANCILDVITMITRVHPALSSWVYFHSGEMTRANITSFIKRGTHVAISSSEGLVMRAKVLNHCDPYVTIQYNDDHLENKVERVVVSQIVGIQDAATRSSVLRFDVAMDSAVEAAISEESIGHLILQLRWCKQYWPLEPSQHCLVQCLAERSASLLAFELTLFNESLQKGIENIMTTDKKAQLNQQLLELFDDNVDYSTSRVTDSCPLKNIIDSNIWRMITDKLKGFLQEGRSERGAMQDKNFRSPRNTWSRKRRTTSVNRGIQTPTQPEFSSTNTQSGLQSPFSPRNIKS